MREATNQQEPSSTEGGEVKAGDMVWVLCKVIEPCESLIKVTPSGNDNWFWAGRGQCRPVEPVIKDCLTTEFNSPKIPDSSSDPLAPSPCMDGVNVDQFIEGIMETRGRVSEAIQIGDAVRFVSPGHDRHGTEGILKSIHHGPKNAYMFVSNCGKFHRYCTIEELERITKRYRTPTLADLVNGPIVCEYRDCDGEHWRSGFLVHILNGDIPFLCVNGEQELSGQWDECRIEVGE